MQADAMEQKRFNFMPSAASAQKKKEKTTQDDDMDDYDYEYDDEVEEPKDEYDYEYDDEEYGVEEITAGKKIVDDEKELRAKNNKSPKLGNKLVINTKANVQPQVDVKPNEIKSPLNYLKSEIPNIVPIVEDEDSSFSNSSEEEVEEVKMSPAAKARRRNTLALPGDVVIP